MCLVLTVIDSVMLYFLVVVTHLDFCDLCLLGFVLCDDFFFFLSKLSSLVSPFPHHVLRPCLPYFSPQFLLFSESSLPVQVPPPAALVSPPLLEYKLQRESLVFATLSEPETVAGTFQWRRNVSAG